ncbi:hypothetical protein BUALT_Bualt18G0047000 [Buddleja alternifolia]|uniref:Uncharacterized protein n=1 Tax=Buddleja alternifolia TaxID=168488 RepID=A0AAV6W3I4_9LAMI|nr:hypothetical protein BUALT_Bualt18G0047000 [Buddleja alternifolia]
MDFNVHEQSEVEAGELFDDSWFFGNLLHRKPRMLRSFSDPCTSSNILSDKSYEETYESIKKLPESDGFTRSNLVKAPSMPPSMQLQRRDQNHTAKGSDPRRGKSSNRRKASEKLVRAPSLPTSLGTEEELEDEEEIEFSLGKLIRQASLKCSDNLPPRTHAPKVLTPSCSISRHRSRRKPELESIKTDNFEEKTPQLSTNRLKTQKSLSVLESEQSQGFNDFGFDFNKKDLNQNAINITPGKRIEENEKRDMRRPYAAEAWRETSSAPPVPRWVGKKSREDMKAQIKFWARAVASNVRQEC